MTYSCEKAEKWRLTKGFYKSSTGDPFGYFVVLYKNNRLRVIASNDLGWEHVSVSLQDRCPTWEDMSYVKKLFWSDDDLVVQMHVPKSDYVNCHPHCLHLWRKEGTNDFCERPPSIMVGLK